MIAPRVWTFFYGSFMNLDVLRSNGLTPEQMEVASVPGFDIRIEPLANLVRSDERCAFGVLATATHDELARLYAYAQHDLGGAYLPEAVLAETLTGVWRPALCYIAPHMAPAPAAADYVDRVLTAARQLGLPGWYVERLESFRP